MLSRKPRDTLRPQLDTLSNTVIVRSTRLANYSFPLFQLSRPVLDYLGQVRRADIRNTSPIAIAKREAIVEPDRVRDDLGRKAIALVGG